MHKSRAPDRLTDCILHDGTWYLWVRSVGLASYNSSGAQNFEVASTFVDHLCAELYIALSYLTVLLLKFRYKFMPVQAVPF